MVRFSKCHILLRSFGVVALLLLGACTYRGEAETPIARNLTWFSYLNGDDIRTACGPGTPDRFRLVYNAVRIEQVRAYDIAANEGGLQYRLNAHVFGQTDLSDFTLSKPLDIFSPWQGKKAVTELGTGDVAKLKNALRESGLFEPLVGRLRLSSDDFYWIAAVCSEGKFQFNAFRWPSPRFDGLTFPGLLLAWDSTGIEVNEPRKTDPQKLHGASLGEEMRSANRYNLAADQDGLVGILRLF